jgi:hypothetical protein
MRPKIRCDGKKSKFLGTKQGLSFYGCYSLDSEEQDCVQQMKLEINFNLTKRNSGRRMMLIFPLVNTMVVWWFFSE